MRRYTLIAAAVAIALCASGRPAAAQNGTGPLAITAGWMFPQGDLPDESTFVAGIQLGLGGASARPHTLFLSADWLQLDSDRFIGGVFTRDEVTLIPVLLNYRQYLGESGFYGFVGAGVFWADEVVPEMDISDDISFAWQAGIGYNLSRNFFVEGRFLAGSNPGDDGMWGAQAGIRF